MWYKYICVTCVCCVVITMIRKHKSTSHASHARMNASVYGRVTYPRRPRPRRKALSAASIAIIASIASAAAARARLGRVGSRRFGCTGQESLRFCRDYVIYVDRDGRPEDVYDDKHVYWCQWRRDGKNMSIL
jgi:hypothetical protein